MGRWLEYAWQLMEPDELRKLIAEVQHRRMEPDAVEAKAARGGTPKVFDSLSAFANRPGGGIILFGLDERQGFELVGVGNLLSPDAVAWLNRFAQRPLNDRQRLALVYLRQHEQISNADYRCLNHVDGMLAGQELRGLVQEGLIEQHGVSRWTYYTLKAESEQQTAQQVEPTDEERILAHVREQGSISNTECRQLLDIEDKRAWYLLSKLVKSGALKREGRGRWSRYVLA